MTNDLLFLFELGILESFLAGLFVPLYYRYGIPVFSTRLRMAPDKALPNSEEMESFSKSSFLIGLRFRELGSHEFAFRERFWGNFLKISYTPVMRGYLKRNEKGVHMVGYLNYFVLFFIPYFIFTSNSFTSNHEIEYAFVVFPLALVVGIYLLQRRQFLKIINGISHSDGNASNDF